MTPAILVIVIAASFLILADIALLILRGIPGTISATMWKLSQAYPIIPFALGVLMGHFFWQLGG